MAFVLEHVLESVSLDVATHVDGDQVYFTYAHSGSFEVLHTGRLYKYVGALVVRHSHDQSVPDLPAPTGGIDDPTHHAAPPPKTYKPPKDGLLTSHEAIPGTFVITDPLGQPFTADEVTLADLRRYRDARGLPAGQWSYTLVGESKRYTPSEATNETITAEPGELRLAVWETVPSESAPPMIAGAAAGPGPQAITFDLYRVGTFIARVGPAVDWQGSLRLIDPDGVEVAASTSAELTHQIDLEALGKSRDRSGRPREWSLAVLPTGGGAIPGTPTVTAQVYGTSRVATKLLNERITKLIGEKGNQFVEIFGRNKNDKAQARLIITDPSAAETIDMHDLLKGPLSRVPQDPPLVATDIIPGAEYTLFSTDDSPFDWARIDVGSLMVDSIEATVGGSSQWGANTPAIKIKVTASGDARFDYVGDLLGTHTLAHVSLKHGSAELEVGLHVSDDGVPGVLTWIADDLIDLDLDYTTLAEIALIPGGAAVDYYAAELTEFVEIYINYRIAHAADDLFGDPDLLPKLLMAVSGAHLTYTGIHMDGDDLVFEYVAPLEPDPQPRDDYIGAIGRELDGIADGRTRLRPASLGDTWANANLTQKIDHIVLVMMENRSFDHVLGYRSLDPLHEPADGWTTDLIGAIAAAPPPEGEPAYQVRNLANADFPVDEAGMMTRIPKEVAHSFKAVARQLDPDAQIAAPGGGQINGPKGFVDSFIPKIGEDDPKTTVDERMGVKPSDVLGYYDGTQLPIYEFLARNYAYSDHYFCSHPGPTLPNRMFSLTGDLQHDRFGVPIIDDSHADNFVLSRSQTIFDVLTKKGISWRVYESAPSVAMLRMFARYVGNATDIRSIDDPDANLEKDLADRGLPAFTVIEPAMHHAPENDDHPDADMWRGQVFIRRVYEAIRSLPAWDRTLMIITYDEHGGLYDHVIPPLADIFDPARETGGLDEVKPVVSDGQNEPSSGGQPSGGQPSGGSPTGTVHINMGHRGSLGSTGPGDTTPVTSDGTRTPAPPDLRVLVPYGVRVPTFVVSPWVAAGPGPGVVLDHCSILKTVLARFLAEDRPFMSDRVAESHSFEDFLTEAAPREVTEDPPVVADLSKVARRLAPDGTAIDTPPISKRKIREDAVDSHALMGHVARLIGR